MKKYPINATWRNSGYDTPIKIVGEYGEMNGITYYKAESGTGIPANEIIWPDFLTRVKNWFK